MKNRSQEQKRVWREVGKYAVAAAFVLFSMSYSVKAEEDPGPNAAASLDRMKQIEQDAEAAYQKGMKDLPPPSSTPNIPPPPSQGMLPPPAMPMMPSAPPSGMPPQGMYSPNMPPPGAMMPPPSMPPMGMPPAGAPSGMPPPSMPPMGMPPAGAPSGMPPPSMPPGAMMAPPSAPPMMPPPQANMAPPPPAMPRQQFPASSNPYVANQPIATVPGLPAYSATNMMGVARQSPGQPMNPLNPESSEVFMQSPTTDTIRERQLQERTREHPEGTEKARYAPLSNDPSIDPLDHGYENWLKNIRGKQADQRDYDEEYEKFVRNISVMLFSLGQKQLSPETSAALKNIPADSLSAVGRSLEPKNPVDIARGKEMKDPFPKDDATVDAAAGKDIGKDVGLNIAVKPATVQVQRLLEMGYDALRSGQTEGAIAIYKNALASDPENKDALFGLATAYHRAGQLDQARDTYIQLINKDPNNWPAMNNFLVLAGEEAPEDALRQLKQLESINPEFGPLSAQIGMIYVQQGKIEDGIKYLSRAITLSPDNLAYRYNLAVVLDHGGYKQQAARLYAQILDFNGEKGQALPESREKIRDRLAFITSQKS